MVNGIAECILANGTTSFIVTTQAPNVKDAIERLEHKLTVDGDKWQKVTDKWQKVTFTFNRL